MRTLIAAVVIAATALTACSAQHPPPTQQAKPSASSGPVGKQRAGTIATREYGGRVLNVEQDTAKGKPSWEVELADSRAGRIEVDVARQNGAILEMEHD